MATGRYWFEVPEEATQGEDVPVMARLRLDNGQPGSRINVQFYVDYELFPDRDTRGRKIPDGIPTPTRGDGIARTIVKNLSPGLHVIAMQVVGSTHEDSFAHRFLHVKERKVKSPLKQRTEEVEEEIELYRAEDKFKEIRKRKVESPTAKRIATVTEQTELAKAEKALTEARKVERPSRLELEASRTQRRLAIARDRQALADLRKRPAKPDPLEEQKKKVETERDIAKAEADTAEARKRATPPTPDPRKERVEDAQADADVAEAKARGVKADKEAAEAAAKPPTPEAQLIVIPQGERGKQTLVITVKTLDGKPLADVLVAVSYKGKNETETTSASGVVTHKIEPEFNERWLPYTVAAADKVVRDTLAGPKQTTPPTP